MKKTPLSQVREKFGGKDKLVEELLNMLKRPSDVSKEEMKKRLSAQSNRKLMALMSRENQLKESFGSRDKLVDAIVSAGMGSKKAEDKMLRRQLETLTTGQLLDLARRHRLTK